MSTCAQCSARATCAPFRGEAQSCGVHKRPGMVDFATLPCQERGCEGRPSYAYPCARPHYCVKHRWRGMVNVVEGQCWVRKCQAAPEYSFPEEREWRRFCRLHREAGMIPLPPEQRGCRAVEVPPPLQEAPVMLWQQGPGARLGLAVLAETALSMEKANSHPALCKRGFAECGVGVPRGSEPGVGVGSSISSSDNGPVRTVAVGMQAGGVDDDDGSCMSMASLPLKKRRLPPPAPRPVPVPVVLDPSPSQELPVPAAEPPEPPAVTPLHSASGTCKGKASHHSASAAAAASSGPAPAADDASRCLSTTSSSTTGRSSSSSSSSSSASLRAKARARTRAAADPPPPPPAEQAHAPSNGCRREEEVGEGGRGENDKENAKENGNGRDQEDPAGHGGASPSSSSSSSSSSTSEASSKDEAAVERARPSSRQQQQQLSDWTHPRQPSGLAANRRSHRGSRAGGSGSGAGGAESFLVLDEAITDHGTKWVTGEIAWTKYDIFPDWPVVVRRLRLMPDGETLALIDFFGGHPKDVEVALHSLKKYESLFGRHFALRVSEAYCESVMQSLDAYLRANGIKEQELCSRCSVDPAAFNEFLLENEDICGQHGLFKAYLQRIKRQGRGKA